MKRIFMSILAIGTVVALSAGPVFAGGEVLSDGDLDSITAANFNGESKDTLVGGSGGGVQNNDDSQRDLMALNNVNASQSNVANQANVLFTIQSPYISIVKQDNYADFNYANNGDNGILAEAVVMKTPWYAKDDDVLLGGAGGGVQNNDESQKDLMAINNVNASQSNVANQTNLVSTYTGNSHFAYISQKNVASFHADNGSNWTALTYIKDPKNKDDLLIGQAGGGVQNNNESQRNLMALNNVNASQSNVANQTNIAVAGVAFGQFSIVKQSNQASFSGQNGGNFVGGSIVAGSHGHSN